MILLKLFSSCTIHIIFKNKGTSIGNNNQISGLPVDSHKLIPSASGCLSVQHADSFKYPVFCPFDVLFSKQKCCTLYGEKLQGLHGQQIGSSSRTTRSWVLRCVFDTMSVRVCGAQLRAPCLSRSFLLCVRLPLVPRSHKAVKEPNGGGGLITRLCFDSTL